MGDRTWTKSGPPSPPTSRTLRLTHRGASNWFEASCGGEFLFIADLDSDDDGDVMTVAWDRTNVYDTDRVTMSVPGFLQYLRTALVQVTAATEARLESLRSALE